MAVDRLVIRHRGLALLAAGLIPLLVCALLTFARGSMENTNAALILVLLVVGAASLGLRSAGLLAAVSSAVWFDFFLTAPYGRFTIDDPNDIETLLLLILVGAAVTEIALWGRRQQAKASQETGYLSGVLDAAAAISVGSASASTVIEHVARQLVGVLDLDRVQFVEQGDDQLPTLQPDGSVTVPSQGLDVDRAGLPTDTQLRLPVRNAGVKHGEFLLTAASHVARPSREQRRVACLLADQVGATLAHQNP